MRSPVSPSSKTSAPIRWTMVASWLIVAAPFVLFAITLPHFGALPRNDYWGDLARLADQDLNLLRDPLAWLGLRSNEHWIGALIPLWLANFALTGGDNRGLAAISLALLAALFVVLYRRLPEEVRRDPSRRIVWGLPLAAAVATPAAAHNWTLGFSGNQWFLANLLAAISIARLVRGPRDRLRDLLAICWPLAVAAITHSTHLSLAAALVVGALVVPQARRLRIGLLLAAAASMVLFLFGYERPAHHPPPSRDPVAVALFALRYLGGAFTEHPAIALLLGAAGIGLLAFAAIVILRARRPAAERFWLLIAVYGGSAAALTAIGRANMGAALATATSRYASLQALFWIGTFAGAALALRTRHAPRSALAGAVLGTLLLGGLVANHRLGIDRLIANFNRARWLPVAELALRWNVRDDQVLAHASPFIPSKSIRFLRRIGHVPFDRPAEGPPGAEVGLPPAIDELSATGVWTTTLELPRRGHFRVSGSLPDGQDGRGSVLLVDRRGFVRGAAVVLPERGRGPGLLLGRRPPARSWIGYLERRHLAGVTPVFVPESAPAFRLGIGAEARSPAPFE